MVVLQYALLAFQLIPAQRDIVGAIEIQQRLLKDRIAQQERDVRVRQDLEQQRFAKAFNQLVDAVSDFSRRYNEGKGATWPSKEAEQLRRAMHDLQSLDKSLQSKGGGSRIGEKQ